MLNILVQEKANPSQYSPTILGSMALCQGAKQPPWYIFRFFFGICNLHALIHWIDCQQKKKHLFRCFTIPHLDMGCSSFARVRRERESLFSRSTSRSRKLSLFLFDHIEFSSLSTSTKSSERANPKSIFSAIIFTINIIIIISL